MAELKTLKVSGSYQDLQEHFVAINQYYIVGKRQTTMTKKDKLLHQALSLGLCAYLCTR